MIYIEKQIETGLTEQFINWLMRANHIWVNHGENVKGFNRIGVSVSHVSEIFDIGFAYGVMKYEHDIMVRQH